MPSGPVSVAWRWTSAGTGAAAGGRRLRDLQVAIRSRNSSRASAARSGRRCRRRRPAPAASARWMTRSGGAAGPAGDRPHDRPDLGLGVGPGRVQRGRAPAGRLRQPGVEDRRVVAGGPPRTGDLPLGSVTAVPVWTAWSKEVAAGGGPGRQGPVGVVGTVTAGQIGARHDVGEQIGLGDDLVAEAVMLQPRIAPPCTVVHCPGQPSWASWRRTSRSCSPSTTTWVSRAVARDLRKLPGRTIDCLCRVGTPGAGGAAGDQAPRRPGGGAAGRLPHAGDERPGVPGAGHGPVPARPAGPADRLRRHRRRHPGDQRDRPRPLPASRGTCLPRALPGGTS